MSGYSPRYGLTAEQVEVMKAKLYKIRKRGATDWENITDFCQWAVAEGYRPGMRILRLDSTMPHSKENSYFVDERTPKKQEVIHKNAGIGSPCATCVKPCEYNGCQEWEDYYKQNWQKNIHVDIPQPVPPPKPQVFRYEHPDLVREGAV